MLHIVLYQPRIPQNTGNIARSCVVTGTALHLIKPYAFHINDKHLRRAGLTYWPLVDLHEYDSFEAFMEVHRERRIFLFSSKGDRAYHEVAFRDGDMLLFGREDTGVPEEVHRLFQGRDLRIPMRSIPEARCLNQSASVGIALYEALRQLDFKGLK